VVVNSPGRVQHDITRLCTTIRSLRGEPERRARNATLVAEPFFSRLRRAEMGHHHHVAGPYLVRYAQESAWPGGQAPGVQWGASDAGRVSGAGFAAFAGFLRVLAAA